MTQNCQWSSPLLHPWRESSSPCWCRVKRNHLCKYYILVVTRLSCWQWVQRWRVGGGWGGTSLVLMIVPMFMWCQEGICWHQPLVSLNHPVHEGKLWLTFKTTCLPSWCLTSKPNLLTSLQICEYCLLYFLLLMLTSHLIALPSKAPVDHYVNLSLNSEQDWNWALKFSVVTLYFVACMALSVYA